MKTAVNLTIQVFESRYQKEYLIRFWWLIFSNFTYIRHLVYWKCIIWAKYDLPIINSVCEKVWFTINGLSKMLFLIFAFHFSKFQMTIVKDLMEKPSFFTMDFERSNKVLQRLKYFWSTYFRQGNNDPFKNFWNFHRNVFCFFIFSKWKKYYNLTFDDTFKICCCALC